MLRGEAAALAAEDRWFEAAERWQRLATARPDDANAHRELARTAGLVAAWRGTFVGSPPRFRTDTQLAADRPEEPVAVDPTGTALAAIERAVELRPDSVAWLAPLGELRAAAGDTVGAIAAYERAVEATRTSHSAWVVTSRHLWQFELERDHHRNEAARVDDPLFDAALEPEAAAALGDPPGVVRPRFTHQGLHVTGIVADPSVTVVEVTLGDLPVRTVNLASGEPLRRFDLVLRRPVLDVAPPVGRLAVTTPDGRVLPAPGPVAAVTVRLPHASGTLGDLLADGVRVDKKGGLTPTADEVASRQADLLRLYGLVRDALAEDHGRELFALYGTLLGIHRQGDLIPGDDDFDCGYVAGATDPVAVKAEAVDLIAALVREGFSVSINRRGRLFRVHHDAIGDASLHLDVHPVWFEGPDLYVHNHHRFPAVVDDLLPAEARDLRGEPVLVPRRPEVLLERFYGPGWRTPDPGYVDDATGADPAVMTRLGEALLSPEEFRALDDRLAVSAADHPGQGRLVSIASQPLYPLDDVIE
ncbi:tetratricopeptide repeat protein [Nitriliruptor alkaliphilus]|uniref:tetratricopeptide repeat protein n=1 Tax=Nitriliruptor alkaliphilus TaxID=427918 RepID=UPI000699162E|nr:hypothetical protein [Nitriliruptor alkaliphilus]